MGDYQTPTPAEFATWLTPRAALMRIGAHFGDSDLAQRTIDGRLKGAGYGPRPCGSTPPPCRDRAGSMSFRPTSGSIWPPAMPTGGTRATSGSAFPQARAMPAPSTGTSMCGFDPADVALLLAEPQAPARDTSPQPGRPAAQGFLGRSGHRHHEGGVGGELQVSRQADVERWMLDWAARNGHEIGETSVKAPAKKILAAHEGQKTNF